MYDKKSSLYQRMPDKSVQVACPFCYSVGFTSLKRHKYDLCCNYFVISIQAVLFIVILPLILLNLCIRCLFFPKSSDLHNTPLTTKESAKYYRKSKSKCCGLTGISVRTYHHCYTCRKVIGIFNL